MNLYDREIVRGYRTLKRWAIKACREGNVEKSISLVKHASSVANQLTWQYNDTEMDCLMDDLSCQMIPQDCHNYLPHKKRVVFYDQYGKSFILALQYIYAITAAGYEILYVLSDYLISNKTTFIVDDLRLMTNVTVEVIPLEWDYQRKVEFIYKLTMRYAPEKLFLHVKMFSSYNLVLPALPNSIIKYYIDLQDHAWWIKNNNLDYVIPYRDWGATIDIEKRGFKESQVLKIPYYPITVNKEFQGFPVEVKEKVIIFTGGEFYKTVDWDNSYWHLVIRVLIENPSSVILYAGKSDNGLKDQAVKKLAGDMDLSNRLIPIGFRHDIDEVFAHCDIFMGTSPMSGGLMCQYAAYYSKPILQYYRPDMSANNETEQVLDYNGSLDVSFSSKEAFLEEAKRLIEDESYRNKRGGELHDCLIRKEQFDELVKNTIERNTTQVIIRRQKIRYEIFTKWWFYLESQSIFECRKYLISLLKKQRTFVMPFSVIRNKIIC